MFFRRHYCYDCYRHHEWLSFKRGMAAMLILAFLVIGVLDYPTHTHKAHSSSRNAAARHHAPRRHRRDRAAQRHSQPRPKPAPPRRPVRRAGSADGEQHRSPAGAPSLASASQGLRWTSFHGIDLPVSATAGPHDAHGGLASGFTDTPSGALLAAVNIAVRTGAEWGPAIFRPTITSQVTGPNAPALLRADIRSYTQARKTPAGQPSQPAAAVEEAYRFLACTPAAAAIDLVTAGPGAGGNPVMVVTQLRVAWQHGDWRLIAPPAGDWAKASAQVSSLAGYTIFPSVR